MQVLCSVQVVELALQWSGYNALNDDVLDL